MLRRVLCRLLASAPTALSDAATSHRLVDRLKDLKLQGYWSNALRLFNVAYSQGKVGRWQAFHFRILMEMLGDAKQWSEMDRVWETMKAHGDVAIDENCANSIIHALRRGQNHKLAVEVMQYMEAHKFYLHPGSRAAIVHLVARSGDWQTALHIVQKFKSGVTLPSSPAGAAEAQQVGSSSNTPESVSDGGVNVAAAAADQFKGLTPDDFHTVMKSLRSKRAIDELHHVMELLKIPWGGDDYAVLIAATDRSDWKEGLAIFDAIIVPSGSRSDSSSSPPLKVRPTLDVYHAAILLCGRARQKDQVDRVLKHLLQAASADGKEDSQQLLRPNTKTLDIVTLVYERIGDAHAVINSFELLHSKYGVKGSGKAYSALLSACSRLRRHADVLRIYEEMKKEGVGANLEGTVSLINAFSNPRVRKSRRY